MDVPQFNNGVGVDRIHITDWHNLGLTVLRLILLCGQLYFPTPNVLFIPFDPCLGHVYAVIVVVISYEEPIARVNCFGKCFYL